MSLSASLLPLPPRRWPAVPSAAHGSITPPLCPGGKLLQVCALIFNYAGGVGVTSPLASGGHATTLNSIRFCHAVSPSEILFLSWCSNTKVTPKENVPGETLSCPIPQSTYIFIYLYVCVHIYVYIYGSRSPWVGRPTQGKTQTQVTAFVCLSSHRVAHVHFSSWMVLSVNLHWH